MELHAIARKGWRKSTCAGMIYTIIPNMCGIIRETTQENKAM